MSWTIGLYVGESFAEISAKEEGNPKVPFWRWYLPQISLEKGIQRFLMENSIAEVKDVILATRLARQIIGRRLGQVPALLVTEGFENWPKMNLPVQNEHFSMNPLRSKPPLSNHLIFGISGRINAQGEEEKPIDFEELDFLVAKLQLNKIKHAVLGLLHSTMNPVHEKQVEGYLIEKGIQVYPSYHYSAARVEKPRWWHSVLNAYLEPAFSEIREQIIAGFEGILEYKGDIRLVLGDSPPSVRNWDSPLGSLFGSVYLLNSLRQDPSESMLFLGLEEFFLLPACDEIQTDWISDFGRVYLPHPETQELRIQPSTVIVKSAFGCPTYSREIAGFEPGPMCFGKGVNPLFLDLLFARDRLGNIEIFHHHFNQKMGLRVKETLSAYSRESIQGSQHGDEEILQWMEDTALQLLASEIRAHSGSRTLRTSGPMSSVIVPLLEPLLDDFELSPLSSLNRPLSEHLLRFGEIL
ncbi:MAG: hypothetical protein KDD35_03335 [Bdellovibrionales bacterium]|nr:hypothetical protein [Bdellovibrionales bacterium]